MYMCIAHFPVTNCVTHHYIIMVMNLSYYDSSVHINLIIT